MRKLGSIYNWPITEIRRLAESPEAETYANALAGDQLDTFVKLTEVMRAIGRDMEGAKAQRVHLGTWMDLVQAIQTFAQAFPDFPGLSEKKLKTFALVANELAQTSAPFDADEIRVGDFEIRALPNPLPRHWFVRENLRSFPDSMVLFCCADYARLVTEFSGTPISPRLAFHFLAALQKLPDLTTSHAVLVKKSKPGIEAKAIEGFVKLVILSSGQPLTQPQELPASSYNNSPRSISTWVRLSSVK